LSGEEHAIVAKVSIHAFSVQTYRNRFGEDGFVDVGWPELLFLLFWSLLQPLFL